MWLVGFSLLAVFFRNVFTRLFMALAKDMPSYRIRSALLRMAGYRIASQVFIGDDLLIRDERPDWGKVTIGNRVAISDRVRLVGSSNANFSRIQNLIGEVHRPIVLEDDAWLGAGVIVVPSLTIGRGAVVEAGAVVTRDVPSFTVVVGVPARAVKRLVANGQM